MTRTWKICLAAGIQALIWLCPDWVLAQQEVEEKYEPTLAPGLRIYSDKEKGSSLALAARMRASVVLKPKEEPDLESAPEAKVHTVVAGDTLWSICYRFFDDPYVWPRIWSYNTKITNPNWIYPGDTIWLVPPIQEALKEGPTSTLETIDTATEHLPAAILVHNRGFVDKKLLEQAGTLVGAHKVNMLLVEFDEAYVEFGENLEIQTGDEFAAYEILGPVGGIDDPETEIGKLVEILGYVRVTRFDPSTRIARVVVDESMKPLERGLNIGPVRRRFDFIPTVVNNRDLKGRVIAFLDPIVLAAQHHIAFVDRGAEDGVREGNRFFVVEKRDNYKASVNEPDARPGFPTEIVAELRVVEARPHTSTCLVTGGIREIEVGDYAEMRRGY